MTNKQKEKIRLHIIKNYKKYSQGYTMSYKQFRRLAGFIVKGLSTADPSSTKDIYKFIKAQGKLNKVLSHAGLKLVSSNYYTQWHIASDTMEEVNKMINKSYSLRAAANTLRIGYTINRANPLKV